MRVRATRGVRKQCGRTRRRDKSGGDKPRRSFSASGRRGVVAAELILVLPLLLIVLLGMAEFAMLLSAREQLLAASREGARVASHGGADRQAVYGEVAATVKRTLGQGRLGDADVRVCWHPEDPDHPENGRECVEVVVQVGATHAVPNLLGWAGLSLAHDRLTATTVMNVE